MNDNAGVQLRPQLQPLAAGQIQSLCRGAFEVLQKTGIRVAHAEGLALLAEAGCAVEDGSLVRVPVALVEQAIATAPKRIVMYDRLGQLAMDLHGRNTYYGTGSDLAHTYDVDTGELRASVAADTANMAKVADYLPGFDFVMSYGIPFDRPNELHYRHEFMEMVSNTTKPIAFTSGSGDESRKIIEMAAIAVDGFDNLKARPFILNYSQPISPLQHAEEGTGKLIACADLGIPVNCPPGLIPGATAPTTLAGAVTLSLAEALSGLTIHQLKRKGAPIILGGAHGCMDMQTTINVYAGPERLLTEWMLCSVYQHLGIPTWGFGPCSDAQVLDEQASLEFGILGLWAPLAGVNLAHDTGYLGSGMIGALEALVLSDEVIGYARHVTRGVALNADTQAIDVIDRVGPGGSYLGDDHTVDHFRTEFWRSELLNRQVYDNWKQGGEKHLGQKLNDKARHILDTHKPAALSEDKLSRMAKWLEA